MDITLERILSLIPKKENGDFVFGAKKEFALSIGYTDGQIVSMWISGTSDSYKNKLYEIASVYDVSVAWLKGESDTKKEPPVNDEKLNNKDRLKEIFNSLTKEEQDEFMAYVLGKYFPNKQ